MVRLDWHISGKQKANLQYFASLLFLLDSQAANSKNLHLPMRSGFLYIFLLYYFHSQKSFT